MIPEELMEVPEIAEAIEALKESSYNEKELEQYERYWDIVRTQKAFVQDALKKGKIEGKIEGKLEGKLEERIAIGRNMKSNGFAPEDISKVTGLTIEEVTNL